MPRRFAPRLPTLIFRNVILGGEGGIRTHGTVSCTLLFESGAFDHSATSPYLPNEFSTEYLNFQKKIHNQMIQLLRRSNICCLLYYI